MERLLDFSQPVDVALLEQVVQSLNIAPDATVRAKANEVLTRMKEHPDAWTVAPTVLAQSKDPTTRFFALQVLEDAIKFRWKALPAEQREGVRNYVVEQLIEQTSKEGASEARVFVNKLNLILVHILKQEWPHNWPQFIPEIVGSSRTSESLCENNMSILKLLSEEVFDFSKEEMTSDKVAAMKNQLNQEFRQIFELCQLVLTESTRPSLIAVTLQTLLRFTAWVPLGYIFETPLVEQLLTKFLPDVRFRNDTLACLTEIVSVREPKYDGVYAQVFAGVMALLERQLPPDTDIPRAFDGAGERDCNFIRGLSLFLSAMFLTHLEVCERPEHQDRTKAAMFYLVSISMVDDKDIFSICLEVWNKFAKDLFEGERANALGGAMNGIGINGGGGGDKAWTAGQRGGPSGRAAMYETVLSRVRSVMVSRMAKPEEVLVVESDDGSIVRETTKDTDAIAQYKTMRDTLVYLTHLNYEDTENIMLSRLNRQCRDEFSWHDLNTLCWAMGSISGSMGEDDEKRFLVVVIKDLLMLCEMKRGKDNKAVVASNIMYVVSQYPRFLRAHWKFLKTVVNKVFEFMHEPHPGVQDMACDTFLTIARRCREQFVLLQSSETTPFTDELLQSIVAITQDLAPHQRHTFYEAVGFMVREQPDEARRADLLARLMAPSSEQWRRAMQLGSQTPAALTELDTIKTLADILRTNVRVCTSMGYAFRPQLMSLYLDMLHVYSYYGERVSESVRAGGDVAVQHKNVKAMRAVKSEVLRLVETFVASADNASDVAANFVPPLLEPVLGDYQKSVPKARSAEVLQLFTAVVERLKGEAAVALGGGLVQQILGPVFMPTLEMISSNHTDFPEHRGAFYRLLRAMNQHCFARLFDVPPDTQKSLVDAVVWAVKNPDRNVSETGLETLDRLLTNVAAAPEAFAQPFYQRFFLPLLQDVLVVLTDRLHVSGFSAQAAALQHMFAQVQRGQVQVPLGPDQPAGEDNRVFLHRHTCQMIAAAFSNVGSARVEGFVTGLFDPSKDQAAFKAHMRDFLITLKEFSADEVAAQFQQRDLEERRIAEQREQMQRRAAIPGMLTQQEQDDMADL